METIWCSSIKQQAFFQKENSTFNMIYSGLASNEIISSTFNIKKKHKMICRSSLEDTWLCVAHIVQNNREKYPFQKKSDTFTGEIPSVISSLRDGEQLWSAAASTHTHDLHFWPLRENRCLVYNVILGHRKLTRWAVITLQSGVFCDSRTI